MLRRVLAQWRVCSKGVLVLVPINLLIFVVVNFNTLWYSVVLDANVLDSLLKCVVELE
jgi:hypothetical protein